MLKKTYPVIKGNTAFLSALFSRTIFRICLLKDSSSSSISDMDRFLSINKQKSNHDILTLGRAVCILGPPGIGKTWLVNSLFPRRAEITADILQSKQDTIRFLSSLEGADVPVVLDEYECLCDLIGMSEITKIPSSGQFLIISQIPVKFNFQVATWNFPILDSEKIFKLFPDADPSIVASCRGDVRRVKFSSDSRDVFFTTPEFIQNIVCKNSTMNPVSLLGDPILEPGNITSILNENYIDVKDIDIVKVSEYFSQANVFEKYMYNGCWSIMPYYNLMGIIYPAKEINHGFGKNLRAGSTWTRYQNACMRSKRVRSVLNRHSSLTLETLIFIRKHVDILEEDSVPLLKYYRFEPGDIDIINHLSPLTTIKPKLVKVLKNRLIQP